jgi:hypothetical protein
LTRLSAHDFPSEELFREHARSVDPFRARRGGDDDVDDVDAVQVDRLQQVVDVPRSTSSRSMVSVLLMVLKMGVDAGKRVKTCFGIQKMNILPYISKNSYTLIGPDLI